MTKIETINRLTVTQWRDLIVDEIEATLMRHSRNCVSCRFLEHDTQICRLAGKMPPPKVAIIGCEYHDEDIPF